MPHPSVRVALVSVFVAGLLGCAERRRVLVARDVEGAEELRQRADVYAHPTLEEKEELLKRVATGLPPGSPLRVEVLLRLVDLHLEQARDLAIAPPSTDEPGACRPDRPLVPSDRARAEYEGALSVVALLRAEVPQESEERAEVEWRAALASRGLALNGETRDALLAVIKGHPRSPLVPEALLAFGDCLWAFGGDEYKMCETYKRASEDDEFYARSYALLQLGRCSIGYGDLQGARRALEAAALAKQGPRPVNWRCDDVSRAASDELGRLSSEAPAGP